MWVVQNAIAWQIGGHVISEFLPQNFLGREFNGPEWILFLLNWLTLFAIGVGLTLKLKKGGCVWVMEVRRGEGGFLLGFRGCRGSSRKRMLFPGFLFFQPPARL
jgi:hypothetical protein